MLGRIAIHLNDDKGCQRRIDAGLKLAAAHQARAIGVYPAASVAGLQQDENILPQEIRQALRGRQAEHLEATRSRFLEQARSLGVDAEVRVPQGEIEEALALHARYCDLLVMSKSERNEGTTFRLNLPETIVMAAGRPVLLVPNYGEFRSIGERVLYCWDQRRESARAFTDAAPILRSCKSLTVLEVDRDEKMLREAGVQDQDFSNYCTSLGYPEPVHMVKDSTGYGVGNIILNTAADTDSDLIVMGAYGHSRMRQWIMGGATSTLLASMTVPVLLAN